MEVIKKVIKATNINSTNDHDRNKNSNFNKKNRKRTTPSSVSFSICTYNIWFGPPHPSKRMEEIARLLLQEQKPSPTTTSSLSSSSSSRLKPKPLFIGLQEVTPHLAMELFPLLQSCGYNLICQDLRSLHESNQYGCAVAVLTENIMNSEENNNNSVDNDETKAIKIVSSGFVPFTETMMNRGFVFVHGRIVGMEPQQEQQPIEILFTTTHLESFVPNYPTPGRTYDGVEQRESQMKQMTTFCDTYLSKHRNIVAAFVTGDLNWDDERPRSKGVDKTLLDLLNGGDGGIGHVKETNKKQGSSIRSNSSNSHHPWIDAWKINQGKKSEGYTYDSKINPMLRGNLRRRFDRILIRENCYDSEEKQESASSTASSYASSSSLRIKSTNMFGMEPIHGLEWKKEVIPWGRPYGASSSSSIQIRPVLPSDHYGLWAVMDYSSMSSASSSSKVCV
mmetsp:Transcript_5206/g.7744  ORF Transcript_5206/g.7744 Transcript_5206/m.7744 type:complete len:449 (-) Transcript_5206:244-1590(-)